MALKNIVSTIKLDEGLILAPDRYDPRRKIHHEDGLYIADVVVEINKRLTPSKISKGKYVVLDTSDAHEGVFLSKKEIVTRGKVGSTKKVIKPGDIIISRLRPYLRQVAYIDKGILQQYGNDVTFLCSTEFYVLRSQTRKKSIAFLAPLLLSKPIQKILDVSQEGGHHPRFNKKTLMTLPVPDKIISKRQELSKNIIKQISKLRKATQEIDVLINTCSCTYD